jgi:hypothetical protein
MSYLPPEPKPCPCGSGKESWWMYDCYGIELDRVCESCEDSKRKRYTPETFTGYRHLTDEPIEPEDY